MKKRGLSLERLHTFLLVADAGSIVRAAGADPVRQSQFSRQLGELEEFFGTQLTQRTGRSLRLTEAGRRLAITARTQFDGLNDFLQEAEQSPVQVSIGAGDSLISWTVIPKLAELQKKFPRLRVKVHNLRSRDIVERLRELRLDFGLIRSQTVRPPLKQARLGSYGFRLFVPKTLVGSGRQKPETLLASLPLALLGSDTDFYEGLMDVAARRGIALPVQLLTDSFPQAMRAVREGGYASVLPEGATKDLDPKEFKSYPLPFLAPLARTISLAWNPRLIRTRLEGDHIRLELARLLSFA